MKWYYEAGLVIEKEGGWWNLGLATSKVSTSNDDDKGMFLVLEP